MPTCISTYSESKGRKEQVFENKELRKIFGPKQDEVSGEHRGLYRSLNRSINRIAKSRLRWGGYVARTGEKECIRDFGGETA